MGRKRFDDALFVGRQVLRRQHVIDARPGRRLEDTLGERVGYEALDLFGALPLSAKLGHLQNAWEERARTLRIHTLWLLACGQRVLDDGGEAVPAIPDLDVAGLVEDINGRLACHWRRAGAESQGDLFLPIHELRRLAPCGLRGLSRDGSASGEQGSQSQQVDAYHRDSLPNMFGRSAFHRFPPLCSSAFKTFEWLGSGHFSFEGGLNLYEGW